MDANEVLRALLTAMPYWNAGVVRPLKQSLAGQMSAETYYCLELLRQRGGLSMTEIAVALRITKQQATRLVERLAQYEMVERVTGAQDRRQVLISITPAATKYLGNIAAESKRYLDLLQERLTADERRRLAGALVVISELLQKLA